MSRKHFEAIAKTIAYQRKYVDALEKDVIDNLANELSVTLSEFSPHFNRDKFIAACKGE